MNKAVVIDPNESLRKELIQNLNQVRSFQVIEFNDFHKAFQTLAESEDFQGIIFFPITNDLNKLQVAIETLRQKHKQACLVPVLSSVTADHMQFLTRISSDHVLLRPFTSAQLKTTIEAAEAYRSRLFNDDITNPIIPVFQLFFDKFTDQYYRAIFVGAMTENCTLPEVPAQKNATLFVDCDRLTVINSIGIKAWFLWFQQLEKNGFTNFVFENLGPGFLQMASFVKGFIPKNGTVGSFYLHYWESKTDTKRNFRYVLNKDYSSEKIRIPAVREEFENGAKVTYEIDDSASLILRFFKGTVEII